MSLPAYFHTTKACLSVSAALTLEDYYIEVGDIGTAPQLPLANWFTTHVEGSLLFYLKTKPWCERSIHCIRCMEWRCYNSGTGIDSGIGF